MLLGTFHYIFAASYPPNWISKFYSTFENFFPFVSLVDVLGQFNIIHAHIY